MPFYFLWTGANQAIFWGGRKFYSDCKFMRFKGLKFLCEREGVIINGAILI